jgi:hypothetical protein
VGPDFDTEDVLFGFLQYTITEVKNALLDLDGEKGPGYDGVPPLVLKSMFVCAFILNTLFRVSPLSYKIVCTSIH